MTSLYLSDLFRYTEQFNIKGHKMGRKTGDLLDMLVMGAIYENEELKKRTVVEGTIEGFTTAPHKIGFSLFQLGRSNKINKKKPLGIIECKKVGVEVAKAKRQYEITQKSDLNIKLANRCLANPICFQIHAEKVEDKRIFLQVFYGESLQKSFMMEVGDHFKIVLDKDGKIYFLEPNEVLANKITTQITTCKIVELDSIRNNVARFNLYKCLPGPQTIEKAKQIAFVSMDLRKRFNGMWDALPFKKEDALFKTIMVIGEASHWEGKSLNIVKKCMDHILIVPDEVLIELLKKFQAIGGDNYLDLINKDSMRKNNDVCRLVMEHVSEYHSKMFYDIIQKSFVSIGYDGSKLVCQKIK